MIDSFRNEYYFLSNFYNSHVEYNGLVYTNNEAAFQAQKCPERAREFTGLAPNDAKRLGRQVKLRPDWEEVKLDIMTDIVRSKFNRRQHPVLCRRLLETGDEELVEGNYWNDYYWGVCKGHGENHLGKILMQVREELKENK